MLNLTRRIMGITTQTIHLKRLREQSEELSTKVYVKELSNMQNPLIIPLILLTHFCLFYTEKTL